MGKMLADSTIEYLTRADGQRTGVVLRWEDYQALRAYVPADPDMLVNLSEPELQVLANGMLSSAHQQRLSELLQHNRAETIDSAAEAELDHLIEHVDYMNILKARAKYTLQRLAEAKES
jgi:hypothetical protein